MSFQPSLTFGILAAAVVSAICWAAALIVSARIDRRRVRQAIHLADRRIAILAPRKAAALETALQVYLNTPAGKAVAGDPRITARLELFAALARSRDFDRELHLRRKAEADLLLAPPYEAA
jgi:hypothetical protein